MIYFLYFKYISILCHIVFSAFILLLVTINSLLLNSAFIYKPMNKLTFYLYKVAHSIHVEKSNCCNHESHQTYLSPVLNIKFASWVNTEDPMQLIPPELHPFISHIRKLSTLTEHQLHELGAARFEQWFVVTLIPGTSLDPVLQQLRRLDHIIVAEQAPRPAPPP